MTILEGLLVVGFVLGLGFVLLWWPITTPYLKWQLYKPTRELQWRCKETIKSKEERVGSKKLDYTCTLSYRIHPDSLGWFTRVFSNNSWEYPFGGEFNFTGEESFKEFIKNFRTYGDIEAWRNKENQVLWVHP